MWKWFLSIKDFNTTSNRLTQKEHLIRHRIYRFHHCFVFHCCTRSGVAALVLWWGTWCHTCGTVSNVYAFSSAAQPKLPGWASPGNWSWCHAWPTCADLTVRSSGSLWHSRNSPPDSWCKGEHRTLPGWDVSLDKLRTPKVSDFHAAVGEGPAFPGCRPSASRCRTGSWLESTKEQNITS